MVFTFETNLKVDDGGFLQVGYPQGYVIDCIGSFLDPISLEGDISCSNFPDLNYFEIAMPRPLPPGTHAFGVTSTPPDAVFQGNMFYIMVLDAQRMTVDAAMRVPGLPIQQGIKLEGMDLKWSSADPNSVPSVEFGFTLQEDLPPLNPPTIYTLLFTLPPTFTHEVRRARHVTMFSPQPILLGNGLLETADLWLDHSSSRTSIRFMANPELTATMLPGAYRFSIPVRVPTRMPKYNVFTLTVCNASADGCYNKDSPETLAGTIVTFPIPGFNLNQNHPESGLRPTSAAWHPDSWVLLLTLALSLIACTVQHYL